MILVVYVHPFHQRARANAALIGALEGLPRLTVRSLYDRYPDFDVDATAERAAVEAAHTVVLQHPLYWYAMPALAKLWIDRVFAAGWAYGEGGRAVAGKRFMWAVTTGGDDTDYAPSAAHDHPFEAFVPPVRQFARYCGMQWETPFVVHGAHRIADDELRSRAAQYRARIAALAEAH
jgi:glutathione-regulated potassium-efflux system ancillary protein KefF